MPLTLPWPNHPDPVLRGADGILAAVMWSHVVTLWDTKPDKMEQIHSFDARNYPDEALERERAKLSCREIKVANKHKVAVLVENQRPRGNMRASPKSMALIVVLEKVDSAAWVNKTLACFPWTKLGRWSLALDNDWLACLDARNNKLGLWQGDNSLPEVDLPNDEKFFLHDILLEFPHLMVFL